MKTYYRIVFLFLSLMLSVKLSAFEHLLSVENRTGYSFVDLHIAEAGTGDWSEDLLGEDKIFAGERRKIILSSDYERVDLLAVDVDGDRYFVQDREFRQATEIIFALEDLFVPETGGKGEYLTIINQTGYTAVGLFLRPSTSNKWEEKHQVLRPGQTIWDGETFLSALPNMLPGTRYDLRLEDAEGDSYVKNDVDLFSIDELSFDLDDLEF